LQRWFGTTSNSSRPRDAHPTEDRAVSIAPPKLDRVFSPRSIETGRSRGIAGLPDRIVLIMCVVFAVGAVLATYLIMYWWTFLPVAIIVLALTWRFMPQSTGHARGDRTGSIIAVAFAVVWGVVQVPLASQYLVAIRDPGIYMLIGAVISHTGGSPIDIATAHSIATTVPGLSDSLGPFGSPNGSDIRLQGSNGVPAMIAIGFWLAGVQGGIAVNLVIGTVGLLALYGLARRFMGPYWALLPVAILALSMPYLYFSRTSYTEIMATLIVIASSTWLVSAFGTRRLSDFVVAGAFMGGAALTRVDGALAFAGALVGLILVVFGVGRSEADTGLRWRVLAFAAAGWVLVGLGMIDLFSNNPRYLHDLGVMPYELWAGAALLSVVLLVLCLTPLGNRAFQYTRRVRAVSIVATAGVGALFLFWLSRPAWLINHSVHSAPVQSAVAGLQAQDGLPIEPTRGYDEYSLWWFGWYFGDVFLGLAIAGMCIWLYFAITRRNPAQIVILAGAAVVSVLYLDALNVTPDQIWAFRRVLPVITPVLVLAAVFGIRWLWTSRRRWLRWVAVIAIVGVGVGVFLPWGKIMFTVEGGGQAAEIEKICADVGSAPLVAFVNQDAPANYAGTIATMCNTQVVTIGDTSTFDWKALAAATHHPVAVVTWNYQLVDWVKSPHEPSKTSVVRFWTRHLLVPPRTASITVRSVYVGKLDARGTVSFSG
jgi:hypothetical protein